MRSNAMQVKSDGLPVVSQDEQIQKNSMRLYIYLVSISKFCGKNKPREFSQKDFTINSIHNLLGMHANTIKKYWKILEDNGLVVYQGVGYSSYSKETFKNWGEYFSNRKKNLTGFYKIPKTEPYRIIPRETIDKIQKEFLVEELELKLYLLLANMQEHFCFLKQEERLFTLADLRELLQVSKKVENNKKIIESLHWLKSLNLIKYDIVNIENNLKTTNYGFNLISVNYYTDGGEIAKILSTQSETRLSQEIKQAVLKEQLVYFED